MDEPTLRRIVFSRDLEAVKELYREAVALGWIADCEESKVRLLTILHHAATAAGLNRNRVGALVGRVKRSLDVTRTRQESDQWAQEFLAGVRRDRELADERCEVTE
jgi:hypothetical protein